ncbi:DNA-binding IclR family transcriptional regulator [Oceanisphaera litoralis]|uniref:IclR family transcriptional regulator n=1 Tax=Oceanisphaera litoralis TaxID=225144 RepID=UPI0019597080|nr:IclR family transcriptional regulator [Oceanisphaera litoralis]MBM7456637.1 DNA-binding IclR family transcriptional regulator [Oceanisphaera litoralis]
MSKPEKSTGKQQGGIQVIARAGAIMRALGSHPQGLSLGGIAQTVGLPRSTVQRIISALEEELLVEGLGPSGGFRLGPALGQLIHQAQTDIISLIRPHLVTLSEQLQETTCLTSLVGGETYALERIVAERELRVVFPLGINVPAFATASGKVLLAELPEATLQPLLPATLDTFTPHTLSREALLAQLKEIKACGVAVEQDEYIEGLSSFAVPLDTYLGYYSLTVVVPSTRARTQGERIKQTLQSYRDNIERASGRIPRN